MGLGVGGSQLGERGWGVWRRGPSGALALSAGGGRNSLPSLCFSGSVRLPLCLSICSLNFDFIMDYMEVIDWVWIDPICERPASGVRLDEPNQRSVFGRLSRDLAAAREYHGHACLQLPKSSAGHRLPRKRLSWLRGLPKLSRGGPNTRADSPAIRGPHRRRHPRTVKGAGSQDSGGGQTPG